MPPEVKFTVSLMERPNGIAGTTLNPWEAHVRLTTMSGVEFEAIMSARTRAEAFKRATAYLAERIE